MNQRFPNNEDRRSFRIKRGLSKPSRKNLGFCANLREQFPDKRIQPKNEATDLTIVGKMDIVDIRKQVPSLGKMLFSDLAQRVLEPAPETANNNLLFKVRGVGFIGVRQVVRVAMFLEDPDKILTNEYATYTNRLDNLGAAVRWRGMLPHISLAMVPAESATKDVVEWVERQAPEEVMLMRVGTDPRLPKTEAGAG